jgi:hypothetical protein
LPLKPVFVLDLNKVDFEYDLDDDDDDEEEDGVKQDLWWKDMK